MQIDLRIALVMMAKYSMALSRGITITQAITCCSVLKISSPSGRLRNRKKEIHFFVPKDVFIIDHNASA